MRQSVRDAFFDYTAGREGYTPFLYCDTLNLVTTGVGNLVDKGPNHNAPGMPAIEAARLNNVVSSAAMAPALQLPWRRRAQGWTSKNPVVGDLVSPSEVADAWTKVKRQNELVPNFAQRGGFAYAPLTNITLDMEAIQHLFYTTLYNFEATLQTRFTTYDDWPADAQMALLSMAWAMGPNFYKTFKAFSDAANTQNFAIAAEQCEFRGGGAMSNPTSRNYAHRVMFKNAESVKNGGGDYNRLYFSGSSGVPAPATPAVIQSSQNFNPRIGAIAVGSVIAAGLGYVGYEWWKGR